MKEGGNGGIGNRIPGIPDNTTWSTYRKLL